MGNRTDHSCLKRYRLKGSIEVQGSISVIVEPQLRGWGL